MLLDGPFVRVGKGSVGLGHGGQLVEPVGAIWYSPHCMVSDDRLYVELAIGLGDHPVCMVSVIKTGRVFLDSVCISTVSLRWASWLGDLR